MIRTPANQKRHYVRLDKPKAEDTGKTMTPDRAWASIEPLAPSTLDEERIAMLVKMDYHPDMTLNVRIRTEDGRELWVRGMQDPEFLHLEHWLLCEEVLTP